MTTVGFVGLGNIGKPMALRLTSSALPVHVHDVMPGPLADLEAAGAVAASDVAGIAASCDVICVMVRDDDQVRDVLDQVLAATDGRPVTFVIHSTVSPETPAELEILAAPHGVRVLDAPVSGGWMGAGDGRLAIMVGGSDEAFEAAKPVLEVMGKMIVHAGPIGYGTRFKLARNLMHYVAYTAATESQRLAEAAGLDIKLLGEVVRYTDSITGGPGAIMHRDSTATLDVDDFWYTQFEPLRILAEKDLTFAIGLAEEVGVEVPLARQARDRLGDGLGVTRPA
jgi:3-hydroxyisobutyrate dehydrogenase-like beta-hydroxyacid dehydrogenase